MILKLSEVFIPKPNKQFYSKQELFALKLSSNFIENMQVLLSLSYLETTTLKGNVCFANNSEVQPEFRTIFTKTDSINYINATLNNAIFNIEIDTIPLPTNAANFWKMVEKGMLLT
jgi:hypothetical protein